MVDLENAKHIFGSLYSDVNGYEISAKGRNKLGFHDKAHTYGEITPDAFYKILSFLNPQPGQVLYDLGSGTGKAVILGSLLFDFSKCVGIEYIKELHEAAEGVISRFEAEFRPHLNGAFPQTIELYHKDFLTHNLSDADIVFTHSTCFYDELWARLVHKFEQLKLGAKVITVTKTITSPHLRPIHGGEYAMGWGKATVYFYEKV